METIEQFSEEEIQERIDGIYAAIKETNKEKAAGRLTQGDVDYVLGELTAELNLLIEARNRFHTCSKVM